MKLRSLSAAAVLLLSAPLLAGCVTINVPAAETTSSSSGETTSPDGANGDAGIDDSAAQAALGIAAGALFSYVETYAPADCDFVGITRLQLEQATPLPSYRGTYEMITTNMGLVSQLCANDPADSTALDLAFTTRALASELLLDLKNPLGGGKDPIPGSQAG